MKARRRLAGLLAACALVVSTSAFAQSYPTRPIRWIVTSTPGGAFDLISRALVGPMSAGLGQSLVIDNRPGAGGIVGLESVARAAPDGYTVLTSGLSQIVLERFFHEKLPYDPQRDFAPIGTIGELAFALHVHTSVPVRTLKELVDYSKANPGKLYYGSAGIGDSFNPATQILKQRAGAHPPPPPPQRTAPPL